MAQNGLTVTIELVLSEDARALNDRLSALLDRLGKMEPECRECLGVAEGRKKPRIGFQPSGADCAMKKEGACVI